MKKILLAICTFITYQSISQSVTIVPNQDSTIYFGWPINYNGKLYIDHNQKLAVCNGKEVKEIPSSVVYLGEPIIYNNKLYLNMNDQLGVFDGSAITIIPNPTGTGGYFGTPIVYKNKLYLDYSSTVIPYTVVLYSFDGNNFTRIPNPANESVDNQNSPTIYHNKLFLIYYRDSSNVATHRQLGMYNDTTLKLIANPDSGAASGKFTIYHDKLFFIYGDQKKGYLAQYDDKNPIKIIPNADSTGEINSFYDDAIDTPLVYNNKLYVKYHLLNAQDVLGEYNDTSFRLIYPPNGASLDNVQQHPLIFKNKLYFSCSTTQGPENFAVYSGTYIRVINNPADNSSYHGALLVYNNKLYLKYLSGIAGAPHVYAYNGSTFNGLSNPGSISVINSYSGAAGNPIISNDTLFFGYFVNSVQYIDLAYVTDGVLAVEGLKFSVSQNSNNIILNWQTANEVNTAYFNIQRSTDGRSFTNIGKVAAKGSNKVQNNYAYVDDISQINADRLYYRLQEVDNDGKFNYSGAKTININKNSVLFIISPNPAKDYINITSSGNVTNAQVSITDMNGRTLYVAKQNFTTNQQIKIPASQFAKQVLLVTINAGNNKQQFKVVKN